MILKITNDFNLILNENDYQAFVASIDLLSLHCPACGVVGLFILYGHYKRFVIIDDISSGDCKIEMAVCAATMYAQNGGKAFAQAPAAVSTCGKAGQKNMPLFFTWREKLPKRPFPPLGKMTKRGLLMIW